NDRLPALARAAIARRLGVACAAPEIAPAWRAPGASFVTLTTARGALRGCIGTLEAWRPLVDDVQANAQAAAFEDPRFPPLAVDELPRIRVEVSLLTPPESLPRMGRAELAAVVRPGIDGLIVRDALGRRATFLPQVWEQLPGLDLFLAQLKLKAGIDPSTDDRELVWARYQVEKYREARGDR
ncbi:MAG: AmmeMemoRadiSam system protein A, partial [Zetaproteobacteria bacterium]